MQREFPERPIVGVGVVIWRDDRVLLIQRGKAPRQGQWSLPGGAQELGETVAEAARREVLEETGLQITEPQLVAVVDSLQPDDDGRVRYHYTLVDFTAEWRSGKAVAGGDAAAVAWVDAAALDAYALWDETIRIIEKAAEIRVSSGNRPGL
jgi:ADP-ribose pyrophosphatase YjhB (NUDIX family)